MYHRWVLIVMILQIIMFVVQPQNMERCQVGSDAAGSAAGEFFVNASCVNNSLFQEALITRFFTQFDHHASSSAQHVRTYPSPPMNTVDACTLLKLSQRTRHLAVSTMHYNITITGSIKCTPLFIIAI